MYQVGDVSKCDNDDPKFDHLADAIGFAFTWALHGKYNGDYGDWIGIWGVSAEELYLPDDIAVVNACAPSGPKIFWSEHIDGSEVSNSVRLSL